MIKRFSTNILLVTIILLFSAGFALAQKDTTKLKQEVEVTKAYQPVLPEAVKINDIPKVVSEPTEPPIFDYSIFSRPVFSTIEIAPVAAAKMVGEPKPEMGLGRLSLGVGNYLTPYGEFFFNSKPDKNSTFGMHFKHLSSSGKINLLNDDQVEAPESVNSAEIFGQKFFRKSTLTGSLAYDRSAFTFYGYPGDLLTDVLKAEMIPWFQKRQYFSKGTADLRLKSDTKSAFDFSYDFDGNYHYMVSKTGQSESQFVLSGNMSNKFGNTLGLLNTSIIVYQVDSVWNTNTDTFGQNNQVFLNFNPSAKWTGDNASFQIGLNATILSEDGEAKFMVWPKMKADWSPVPEALTLFVAVDGHLKQNSYSAIAAENPYADPYHKVTNANYKSVFLGGLKGRIGAKTNFVAEASYSKIKDQHFFVTESQNFYNTGLMPGTLNNTFSVVYDDINLLKISGEVLHSVSDNFSLNLKGNYYSFEMKNEAKAWQMPDFDLTFSGIYKPTEQLKFTTDIFVIGKRTALVLDKRQSQVYGYGSQDVPLTFQMDPIIDLNAGVEYQFSKPLSIFCKVNNFGFQKYEQWLGYTNKSLNFLAGINYSF